MRLTRNKIFSGIFIFWYLVNTLTLFDINFLYFRAIFSFIFLITIPGLLIMLFLKIRKIGFWEGLVYTIGFSIAFLMFGGLLINWILPLIGINQPLSLHSLSISFNFLLMIFSLLAYVRNKNLAYEFKSPKLSRLDWFFLLAPLIFPILSVLGAISLNNNGPNYLTMMMLGGIALYVSLTIIFRKKLNSNIYPPALFFMALSLLLMTSLRGWYTTGHDNQEEYFIFQLTKNNYIWNISRFRDPYNACLSLNVLPTIFSSFLNINDLYIYKILFQCLYPFSVIGIFLLIKKYATLSVAFLSTFFFVSFPVFGNDMPMLNRQEISLIFFTLTLLVLFNKSFKSRFKEFIFLIFALGMVVSHYSTSYVASAFMISTYLISFVAKRISKKTQIGNNKYYLSLVMVVGMAFFTFLWNAQLTKTANGLTNLLINTWQNIGKSFSQDLKSSDVLYGIFNWQKTDKGKLLNEYIIQETQKTELSTDRQLYFDQSIYQKYPIMFANDDTLPLTAFGKILDRFSIDTFSLNYYFKQISAKLVQVLLIIGFVILVLKKFRYLLKKIDSEYLILAFVSIGLLGVFILLPVFSVEYGALRFFQQTLTILALPTIVGCLGVFSFLKKNLSLYSTLFFFIFFFLSLYGFVPQLTGGFYPPLNLNNRGVYYDAYYKHKSEVETIKWLENNFNDEYPLQSNSDAASKILRFAAFNPLSKILPVSVQKNAYVYLNYFNTSTGKNMIYFKGNTLTCYYPLDFLNENKNLIYNNMGVKIYK